MCSVHFNSVAQLCLTLCNPMNCSMPGFPDLHQQSELGQTYVHQSVMQSNHLILCLSLLVLLSIFPSIRVFSKNLIVLYLTSYKGNQSWIFIGGTDAEAEAPILWPPDMKNWFIRKGPDAWKDWRQEEKGTTEDEMVGLHHWLNGHEFEPALGDGEGQEILVCCSPWSHRVRHDLATEQQ